MKKASTNDVAYVLGFIDMAIASNLSARKEIEWRQAAMGWKARAEYLEDRVRILETSRNQI